MAEFVELFGEKLQGKAGEVSTAEALSGKKGVLVYFSAHWCPPCRGFTPKLAEFYTKHATAKGFEVVFVSSDRGQSEFNDYVGEMPWLALPFTDRARKEALSSKYKVGGIPTLVVLGPEGKVITTNGRAKVMEDFEACEDFPWVPPTLWEALGDSLVKKDGSTVATETLRGKTFGLYFSAHWCPPCLGFTPILKSFYEEYKAKSEDFEIIFISSDQSEDAMQSYFQGEHGDYLALPFSKRKEKAALSDMCGVEGIPTFAIVGPDGTIINKNGRGKITAGVAAVLEAGWEAPVVGDMDEGPEVAGTDINQCPAIIVLCDGCDDAAQVAARQALEPLAKKYLDDAKKSGDDPKYIFLVAGDGNAAQQVKALTQNGAGSAMAAAKKEGRPAVILFDIPDNGAFYISSATEVTTTGVEAFLSSKEAGREGRLQLGRPKGQGIGGRLLRCFCPCLRR